MAKRTLAQLLTVYADNTTADIGADDGRDLADSTHPESADGHIEMLTSPPSTVFDGLAYYDMSLDQLRVWNGVTWKSFNPG